MKIKRIVNETEMEFELTTQELQTIYDKKELNDTIADVVVSINSSFTKYNNIILSNEDIEKIAQQASKNISRNDSYYEAYWNTIEQTIIDYIEDIKNKEEL